MEIDIKRFKKYVGKNNIIFCHHNADPDAVCSAQALKELIIEFKPGAKVNIVLPGGPNRLTSKIVDIFNIKTCKKIKLSDIDLIVVVDTGSIKQLEEWEDFVVSSNTPKIFIDHHIHNKKISDLAEIYLINENAISTSEIIYKIYKKFEIIPTINTVKILLVGIGFDSKHFGIGTSDTFRVVADLLDLGGSIPDTKKILTSEMILSERIARLKASQRIRIHQIGDWIISTSDLSSYQSSAARALIGLGADVAIVAGNKKETLKASMRAIEDFYKKTEINLGYLAKRLGEEFDGAGSGHPGAAGLNAKGDSEDLLNRAIELIEYNLKK